MRRTCLENVHELARRDSRVVFVGSDLGVGTLDAFREEMPQRFFMEGMAEQNLIGMAAGLAMEGYIPYVNTIATFLTRRCYEQIAVDLCMHRLPVRLIANGGGLVYAPLGPTHVAIEDMAIMRALPNMTVVAPSDAEEMTRFMGQTLDLEGPCYIRLAKGGDRIVSDAANGFAIGRGIQMREAGEVLLVGTGIATTRALGATELLGGRGIEAGLLHLHTVKPLDEARVLDLATSARVVVSVEEHTLVGGLGSAVADLLADRMPGSAPPLLRLGLPDAFPAHYGGQDDLLADAGLTPEAIADAVGRFLAPRRAA